MRENDAEGLSMHGGRCVFLDDKRCRIYPVRPGQCRSYPFWPELLTDPCAWRLEARRCEGIGRGAAIPVAQVVKMLKHKTALR